MSFDICVLGSANFDLYLIVKHFPIEGETIQAQQSFIKNGGKGANQAVAASRLGCQTLFAGQVGDDDYAQPILKEVADSNVDISFVRMVKGVQTGQAIICLNEFGRNLIVSIQGANYYYDDKSVLPKEFQLAITQSRILLMQKTIPLSIVTLAAQEARKQKKIVALDCGGSKELLNEELLLNLDFLSPNECELHREMQLHDNVSITIEQIKQVFLKKYPQLTLVLKRGERGSAILNNQIYIEVKAVQFYNNQIIEDYKIVDTTGAGDCFSSAFVIRYAELLKGSVNINIEQMSNIFTQCLIFANASAFLQITQVGTMSAMPLRETVDKFIDKYLKQIKL